MDGWGNWCWTRAMRTTRCRALKVARRIHQEHMAEDLMAEMLLQVVEAKAKGFPPGPGVFRYSELLSLRKLFGDPRHRRFNDFVEYAEVDTPAAPRRTAEISILKHRMDLTKFTDMQREGLRYVATGEPIPTSKKSLHRSNELSFRKLNGYVGPRGKRQYGTSGG